MSQTQMFPVYTRPSTNAKYISVKIDAPGSTNLSRQACQKAPHEMNEADREKERLRRKDKKNHLQEEESGVVALENKWSLQDPVSKRKFGGFERKNDENDTNVLFVFDKTLNAFYIMDPTQLSQRNEVQSRWNTIEEADAYMKALSSRSLGKTHLGDDSQTSSTTPGLTSGQYTLNEILQETKPSSTRKVTRSKTIVADTEYARFDDDEGVDADYISDQELADDDQPKQKSYKQKMQERKTAKELKIEDYDQEEIEVEKEEVALGTGKRLVLGEDDSDHPSDDDDDDSDMDDDDDTTVMRDGDESSKQLRRVRRTLGTDANEIDQDMKRLKLSTNTSKVTKTTVEEHLNTLSALDFESKFTYDFLVDLYTCFSVKNSSDGTMLSKYEVPVVLQQLVSVYWPNIDKKQIPPVQSGRFKTFITQNTDVLPNKAGFRLKRL